MNIERLTVICEWLEAGAPHKDGVGGFYMPDFFRDDAECGTTACIGGAAVQWWGSDEVKNDLCENLHTKRAEILGLDDNTANNLFYPDSYPYTVDADGHFTDGPLQDRLEEVTPAWAARCVRKLMETGEVDWLGTQAAES